MKQSWPIGVQWYGHWSFGPLQAVPLGTQILADNNQKCGGETHKIDLLVYIWMYMHKNLLDV